MRRRALLVVVALSVPIAAFPAVASAQAEPTTSTSTSVDEGTTTTTQTAPTSTTAVPAPSSTTSTIAPDGPDAPAPLPPAPSGFAARLSTLYRTLTRITAAGAAAGAPSVTTLDPAKFDASIRQASDDDLAQLYRAAQAANLPFVERTYADIEEVADTTATAAEARRGDPGDTSDRPPAASVSSTTIPSAPSTTATHGSSATMGPVLSALVNGEAPADVVDSGATNRVTAAAAADVPPIDPPPPPYVASPPVEPTETLVCPELPPGPNVGNYAIGAAKIARISIEAVYEAYDPDEKAMIPLPALDVVIAVPRPEKIALGALLDAAKIVEATLTYLRDIYWDCGGIDQFRQAYNLDNVSQQMYALMSQADGTASNVNAGIITVSNQIDQVQRSATSVISLRINEALTRPLDDAPRIIYMLPASEGGYLDAFPVGVQGIVTAAMAAAQESGLPVNSAAPLYLRMADQALADGQFARAFVLYQKTYQHLGR